jgi:hypothetical protein
MESPGSFPLVDWLACQRLLVNKKLERFVHDEYFLDILFHNVSAAGQPTGHSLSQDAFGAADARSDRPLPLS